MTSVDDIESKTNKKFTFTVSNFDTYSMGRTRKNQMIRLHLK